MPKVTVIGPTKLDSTDKIRVAAYCRVSTGSERQHNSYMVQMEYYTHKFEGSDTEILVDIYADEGVSGTSDENRKGLARMMQDCRKGLIDRIYTKSISRFARNIKDCLEYVRELKSLGISICFEKDGVDTAQVSDEMMITIMGSLAQEESTSISRNIRWSIRKRMQNGTFKSGDVAYGYVRINGKGVIHPEHGEIVRKIFEMAYAGYGTHAIAKHLTEQGIPSPKGKDYWHSRVVQVILQNVWYIGDTLFQKTYITETLPHKQKLNHGECDQYYVENTHEALISRDVFDKVQKLISGRSSHSVHGTYTFTKKLYCARCGASYMRKDDTSKTMWLCRTYFRNIASCENGRIEETKICNAFIALHNKLHSHHAEILIPVQQMLRDLKIKAFAGNSRVMDIQKEIAQLREQNHVLATLRTRGFLSDSKYQEQFAELHAKIFKLQRELNRMTRSDDEDESLEQIGHLIDYFEKRKEKMTEFEDEAFSELVDDILVKNNHELEFHLLGGFRFTEYI